MLSLKEVLADKYEVKKKEKVLLNTVSEQGQQVHKRACIFQTFPQRILNLPPNYPEPSPYPKPSPEESISVKKSNKKVNSSIILQKQVSRVLILKKLVFIENC